MLSVYTAKRKEPRIRLRTRISVSGTDASGRSFSVETLTIDVSPHGASVLLGREMVVGSVVEFRALRYAFTTEAIVRSYYRDRASGATVVGLEFLGDEPNPLVIWSAATKASHAASTRTEE